MVFHLSLLKNYKIRAFLKGWGPKLICQILTQKNDVRKTFQSMCGFCFFASHQAKHHAQYFMLKDNAKTIFCAQFCIVSLNICMCTKNHLTLILPSFIAQLFSCLLACKSPDLRHVYTIRFKLKDSLLSSLKTNTMQVLNPGNWNPKKTCVT